MPSIDFIALRPGYRGIEISLVVAIQEVLDSGHFLRGQQTREFEKEWAAYCGQKFCVACANGTDALTLAATALNIGKAAIPANTIWLTGEALHRAGCTVLAAEIGKDGHLERVVPGIDHVGVPLYGTMPTQEERERCRLFDAAHAHGWKPPEHATVAWSFYPTKILGAFGDAGAVTTNDAEVADRLRLLSCQDDAYRSPAQRISRMDEMQAAVLRVKLKYLETNLRMRRTVYDWYRQGLPRSVQIPCPVSNGYLFPILTERRDELVKHLDERGIATKVHYPTPIHHHPAPWAGQKMQFHMPESEYWCACVLSLPFFPGMTPEEVAYVCKAIEAF